MTIPLKGDRGVFDTANYPERHASDLEAAAPTVHNPLPGAAGTVPVSDGSKWIAGTPDAGTLSYTPAVLTDWDGDADPGDVDDALDQLAARTDDLEDVQDHGALAGLSDNDHPQYLLVADAHGDMVTIDDTDTPYTVLATDGTIRCDCASGVVSVVLPAATGSGRVLNVKKIDASANAVTVTPDGAETIDGETTQVIDGQYDNMQIQDAAAGAWDII